MKKQNSLKMKFRIFIITSFILLNISCNNGNNKQKDNSLNEWMVKENLSWINLYEEHTYVSNKNDTLRFEIVNEEKWEEKGGSSVGAPSLINYTKFDYKNDVIEETQPFIHLTTNSDGFAELELYFLNGKFDLITENQLVKSTNFKLKNKFLNDVFIVRSKEIKDTCATQIWWSRSNGILKFITNDEKEWMKI